MGWPARAVARIWALINVGECGEASAVAQRLRSDLDDGLGPDLSRIARQAVSLVCAEAFLRDGRPGDALPHARTAARRAWQAGARRETIHALGLLAAALVIDGRTAEADARCRAARHLLSGADLRTDSGRALTHLDVWSLVLAEAFVVFRGRDRAGLDMLATELASRGSGTGLRWMIPLVGVLRSTLDKDFGTAAALAQKVRGSVILPGCPPLISQYMADRQGSALIQLGSPGEALELLDGMTSSSGHAVCFPKVRAGAHLQLGRPRSALACTQECVDDAEGHSRLALAAVLVRRAAAFEAVGRPHEADRAFVECLRILEGLGGFVPEIGVPIPALTVIARRVTRLEPDLVRRVLDAIVPSDAMLGVLGERLPDDRLSDREREVARLLVLGLSRRRIADELAVSANTVKTQVRSLYRKLGVGSRREAVARLDAEGFGEPSGPPPR
ncbi:HTH-type transcriptional regulator MalT [Acidipropionibacterium virtanenii]|uniref:HTH-type transcriptional regulator MalT n=1 Tax=Acidipropionibacterium virtanenii TaxID=2057246 RepID=A0A344UW07_9ACTN|nr:HTH-type transcriptional regulator MalT [Acidipropionibacterium virtanenii]